MCCRRAIVSLACRGRISHSTQSSYPPPPPKATRMWRPPLTTSMQSSSYRAHDERCSIFTYIGSIFTCDGRARTAVKEHAKCAKKYLMKLIAFFKCNTDMPFIVKKRR